ncbi:MAG: tetratricopeptide repeat protein, partial [Anaerolineaceae bacterium]
MATISLRAYNHEIEEMIAHNQFDQAIAHCRNILKSYPKHIDTYRLLGKAFLENQRYGDAGDIFQRVLSSFPEDFISHVGMSIIREDEGNLDDALWHMERAFELQPSNNAVQGELRRLHGKREGVEPSKIRLTRGALAHMYIRGDLFPQAIAELKIALTEDPTRFDLQTSLAKAYYLSGQLAEAAKISNEIINKLPYSFEANRILAEIYKKSDRKEEAQPYLEKLFELDPYFAYVTDNIPTPEQVNEEAVTLEKLEWQPGTPMPVSSSQPAWAASIGISIENQILKEDNIPDWLLSSQEESKKESQEEESIFSTSEMPEKESEIPTEWSTPEPSIESTIGEVEPPLESMQTSDVFLPQEKQMESEGIQEFSEEKGISDIGTEMERPEEFAPTEIPDWLRSLAPDQSKEPEEPQMETPSIVSSSEKEYSWLDEINPEEGNPEEPFIDKEPFVISSEESEQIPSWLQQMSEETVISEEESVEPENELLSQALTSEEIEVPIESEPKDEFSWLSEPEAGQPERESLEEGGIWLEEPDEENLPFTSDEEEIEPAVEVELPEWLSRMKEDMENHISEPKPEQEIPDWINRIDEPPVSEEDTKPSRLLRNLQQNPPTSSSETIPEITTPEPAEIPEETPFSAIFT